MTIGPHTAPHWIVRYACGHIKAQCACSPQLVAGRRRRTSKRQYKLSERCPVCS